ncbi:MAG: hypothetical protein ACREB5_03615 [Sphingomonadaceae bacterium]
MALLPLPAIAQPVAAAFAPPTDREIRYEVVEQRNHASRALRFTLEQRVRFVRDNSGYRMTVRMHTAASDAPPTMARRFEAAFRPFVGLDITLLLSPEGKPLGLADEPALWDRIRGSAAALRKDPALAPDIAATMETILAAIAALPADARRAKLMENPLRLVGYALPPMAPGEKIENGGPGANATATLSRADPTHLTYAVRTHRPLSATDTLIGAGEMVIDRQTGLLLRGVTREWIGRDNAAQRSTPDTEITVRQIDLP